VRGAPNQSGVVLRRHQHMIKVILNNFPAFVSCTSTAAVKGAWCSPAMSHGPCAAKLRRCKGTALLNINKGWLIIIKSSSCDSAHASCDYWLYTGGGSPARACALLLRPNILRLMITIHLQTIMKHPNLLCVTLLWSSENTSYPPTHACIASHHERHVDIRMCCCG
jgi:hypothetical protein